MDSFSIYLVFGFFIHFMVFIHLGRKLVDINLEILFAILLSSFVPIFREFLTIMMIYDIYFKKISFSTIVFRKYKD